MAREGRSQATTDARIERREQVIELRDAGKSLAKVSAIAGYTASYCSTLYRRFAAQPKMRESPRWFGIRANGRIVIPPSSSPDEARFTGSGSARVLRHDPGSPEHGATQNDQ
jgi:hypothetical protein